MCFLINVIGFVKSAFHFTYGKTLLLSRRWVNFCCEAFVLTQLPAVRFFSIRVQMHWPNDRQRCYAGNPLVGEYKIRLRKIKADGTNAGKKAGKGKNSSHKNNKDDSLTIGDPSLKQTHWNKYKEFIIFQSRITSECDILRLALINKSNSFRFF